VRAPVEDHGERVRQHRTFVEEAGETRPRRQVEDRNHVERLARAPRCAGVPIPFQLAAQPIEIARNFGVSAAEASERRDQAIRDEEAHVLVEPAPTRFERPHAIRSGPDFESQVANAGRGSPGFLRREGSRVH